MTKVDMIAVDKLALEQIAQQLESRMIEPSVLARELRATLADAPAVPSQRDRLAAAERVADLEQEVRSYSLCRCTPKEPAKCRRCRLVGD